MPTDLSATQLFKLRLDRLILNDNWLNVDFRLCRFGRIRPLCRREAEDWPGLAKQATARQRPRHHPFPKRFATLGLCYYRDW